MKLLVTVVTTSTAAVLGLLLYLYGTAGISPTGLAASVASGLAAWAIGIRVIAKEIYRRERVRQYQQICIGLALIEGPALYRRMRGE